MSNQQHGVPHDWNVDSIGSLKGQVIIVTGANIGIGYETALALAKKGAHVVLACRNEGRAKTAAEKIEAAIKDDKDAGSVEVMILDTSSLASVRAFSAAFRSKHSRLDVLINNAGVFAVPFELTPDGTERQFATNHLGHFVLVHELLCVLKTSSPSRIVIVSSNNHRFVYFPRKDEISMTSPDKYSPVQAYGVTKLYNIVFTKELSRRLVAANITGVKVVACHPGMTRTNVLGTVTTKTSGITKFLWKLSAWMPMYQKVEVGVLPILFAATAHNIRNADYYGPWFLRIWGSPILETPASNTSSEEFARDLWEESERIADISFCVE